MSRAASRKTIKLHRAQHAFRHGRALYRGFVAGRAAGKTFCGAYDMICRAQADRTYLVASPSAVLLYDTTFPCFKAIAQDLGVWKSAKLTPYPSVKLTTGAEIRFRSADEPERLRGPNLSGCWLDEASLMARETYDVCIASLREAGERGWLSATFTPRGRRHWTYEVFATNKPNSELFQAKTADNPFLHDEFAATVRAQYGEGSAQAVQELDGQFIDIQGAEFPAAWFEREIWVDRFPDGGIRTMALDPSFGKTEKSDPSSWAMTTRSNDVWYVAADVGRRNIRQILDDGFRLAAEFGPHAVGIESVAFQQLLAGEFQRLCEARGVTLPVYGIRNNIAKELRIRRLGPVLGQGKMRFVKSKGTEMLVDELRTWPMLGDDAADSLEMSMRLWMAMARTRHEAHDRTIHIVHA